MPAAQLQTQMVPFANNGLVLKEDAAQLQPGQYQELTNFTCVQEGCISIRNGSQVLTNTSSYASTNLAIIHTITKLHGTNPDARYIGSGGTIWRSTSSLPSSGANMSFTQVATGTASGSVPYPQQRFTGIRYNAGTTGKPYEFFACPTAMLKDDSTFSTLQKWGIVPPTQPALAALDAVEILPSTEVVSGNARVNTTVSSVSGTAPGYVTITPASMTNISTGALLNINSGQLVVVDNTSSTSFSAYCASTPSGTITCGDTFVTAPTQFTNYTGLSINAAFDGVSSEGYSTDDIVHLGIAITDASTLADMRFRVFVNNSTSDYYEKSVLPSSIQSQISGSQTAVAVLQQVSALVSANVYGPYGIPYEIANAAKPFTLIPTSPITNVNLVWNELDIPKSSFSNVGLAGTGPYNWSNVTGFQVYYTVTSGATPTLYISSIYIRGGYGPNGMANDANTSLLPLDYVYTFRNIVTGWESNPSVLMISANALTPIRQRVAVTILGTGDSQISTSSGDSSVVIYRRGGAFSDGLFRQIGYTTNPGANTTTTFYDTVEDSSIVDSNIALFDNDPPVTSTLPEAIVAKVSAISPNGNAGQLVTLTITLPSYVSDLRNILTVGTEGLFHPGPATNIANLDTVVVSSIPSANQVTVYIQYMHSVGDYIEFDEVVNQPCNLGCVSSTFDSIFLAGDPNSPHTLYKSKTGRPEAFPVEDLEAGFANQEDVGSPSDPIMAVTEFDGEIVCLNLSHIYTVPVFEGAIQAPIQTPSQRGLIGNFAWCRANNEIWFMSYDGIYSWAGGPAVKRSEPINPLFNGVQIGNYPPINFGSTIFGAPGTSLVTFEYFQNEIHILYLDTNSNYHTLRYNLIYNRWSIHNATDPNQPGVLTSTTAQYTEPDTGNLLLARSVTISGNTWALLYLGNVGTTDGWTNTGSDGAAITFAATPAAYTLGAPAVNKQYSGMVVETDNDSAAITLACYYDFSTTADSNDTFTIAAGSSQGRRRIPESFQLGWGKEAYALTTRYSGTSSAGTLTLYSATFNYFPLAQIQTGMAFDWDDLGYPYDKRLYQLIVTYDIPAGHTVTLTMDTITGVVGNQVVTENVQSFTLSPPTGTFSGPTHLTTSFNLQDEVIVKKIRLRPAVNSFYYKFWFQYTFGDFEKYPPDIVSFTEWTDFGYPFAKYAQQIILDVNTNNVPGTVGLYVDGGGSSAASFSVTSTADDRKRILTLPPNIVGKKFRLVNLAGSGGKFQLFNMNDWLGWLKADRGPVTHTYDWDYLEWPYDKELIEVTIEYNTGGTSTTILMDTMTGPQGGTINTAAFTFVLNQPGRALQTFSFPADTYVKQVRLYPQSDNSSLQEWKYNFKTNKMPADVTQFTEWSDNGWPCEKIYRSLEIEINTGGVDCTVQPEGDGADLGSALTVNTTIDDRRRIIALASDLVAKQTRLVFTPGSGGVAQYFNHTFEVIKEPCAVTHWDSYDLTFGYDGYSFIKQFWVQYICSANITVTIYVTDGSEFWTYTLPFHNYRDTERFYVPAINSGVLNKSKKHRIVLDSTDPFKIYPESSRIEWMPVGAQQRRGYQQLSLSEATAIGTGYGVGMPNG